MIILNIKTLYNFGKCMYERAICNGRIAKHTEV
jgi:hypothetical protein